MYKSTCLKVDTCFNESIDTYPLVVTKYFFSFSFIFKFFSNYLGGDTILHLHICISAIIIITFHWFSIPVFSVNVHNFVRSSVFILSNWRYFRYFNWHKLRHTKAELWKNFTTDQTPTNVLVYIHQGKQIYKKKEKT